MKILFLSAWFPYPPNNGSRLRIYNLLRGLAGRHEVTLLTFADGHTGGPPPELARLCREIHILPDRPYRSGSLRALLGLFSSRPRVLVDRHAPEIAAAIHRELATGGYQAVVASQWYTAAYLEANDHPPAIFEEAEVGVFSGNIDRAANPLLRLRHRLTQVKMQRYFSRLLHRFGAVTVASPQERELLGRMVPGYQPVKIIPNGVRLDEYLPFHRAPAANTLIFTGSFHYGANYEAMRWFLEKVYPQVRAAVPGVRLVITGDPGGKALPTIPGVTQTGLVPDVRPYLASSWISLAPLQTGGGTRLKILEAMAAGTPVIATSKGAEGLEARPGEHLLVADEPDAYAGAVVGLLGDMHRRARLVENALRLVREKYDWAVILPGFLDLVEQVAGTAGKPRLLPVARPVDEAPAG